MNLKKIVSVVFVGIFLLFKVCGRIKVNENDQGLKSLNSGNYSEAYNHFTKAIKYSLLGDYIIYYNRGLTAYGLKNFEQAEKDCLKALSSKKNHVPTNYVLGKTYVKLKQYDKAKKYIEIAEGIDSSKYNYKVAYADIYYYTKDYKKALKYFKELIKSEPNNYVYYESAGFCSFELKKNRDSIKYLKKAIKLNPNASLPYFGLGALYMQKKKTKKKAIKYLKIADELGDPNARAILSKYSN